ncbi:MAG: isocitrate dehydrogenase [Gammaproteobacteria bacterium]|nr:isocitrate dehydrogenase [Gammaproteobacteria bacterium]
MTAIKVTELLGDGIGPELRESVHAIAEALPIKFDFLPFDLSLENRESGNRDLFDHVLESMKSTRLSIKYPTVTNVSSPNAVIRRMCNFSVILRPVISIKGIDSNFTEEVFLYIVRIATGGTYDDPGRMIGKDSAISIRLVERDPCRQAARFAFEFARKKQLRVTSSSKHTIQRATDGLFQQVVEDVHQDFQDIPHNVELFDALLAKIILKPEDYQVVVVINEYGDFLSDMASGLIGSIGTGASGNFSFTENDEVDIAMFDPSGGTAPDIAGKNKCNPTAILLAFGMLLDHIDRYDIGHELRLAILSAIADGACTGDIGGSLGTREFTQEILDRLKDKF